MNETPKTKSGWRILRRVLIGVAIFATLIAIFYTEEDWRGWHAWENCKRELEAKGAVLDWDKYIPPPVPDDQNFFKASKKIAFSFVHSRNDAEAEFYAKQVRFEFVPTKTNSFSILDTTKVGPVTVAKLIVISPGRTALEFATNHIFVKLNDPAARGEAGEWIQNTLGEMANGSAGFKFSEFQLSNLPPAQIVVQADSPPSVGDLEHLISADTITNIGHLHVEGTGIKGVFRVLLTGVHITAAADYLRWSDQYAPDFDEIREALKRPYAQIDCDYSLPYEIQIPNFVTMRSLAQTLAQRAQCYLLTDQPEQALRELSLLNDSRRITEGGPTGQPMTLVAAMINVAITGLYMETIAGGFQKDAWQEPQLAALQEQLKEINLPSIVFQAFESEPAATTHTLETVPKTALTQWFSSGTKWALIPKIKCALIPRGWIYQNMATSARLVRQQTEGCDLVNELIQPRKFGDLTREMNVIALPYKFIAVAGIPNFAKAWQTTAHNQTMVNEAQIACALGRYRMAHGEYPGTLDALVPQFIEKLPHDLIGGEPLHYRRTSDGKFLLYSVGWNETDDGGQDGGKDFAKGDWVWKN